ncbi:PKD-like family lipoprotein [Desertivirga arenae]|uniref:PKD-like family lipoprotein n=1 Tax=Desertivirga arenae TaxID=2810309 RepID=UPI001A95F12F|nr:PKD-like family lipoprotein [Pedobacter sp. SYSU D00823]
MNFRRTLILLAVFLTSLTACYEDLGDYDINMPENPGLTNLDTVYKANVGDSLIITPKLSVQNTSDFEFEWRITVIETGQVFNYKGSSLKTIFGLQAKRYPARLTVINKSNGMRYFYNFSIEGKTQFGSGTSVLSQENGKTQFSFIKPDGTVQARLYEAMHQKDLPANPRYLYLLKNQFTGNTPLGYWIITSNGGVRLEHNTMLEDPKNPSTLANNFFDAPETINIGSLKAQSQGVLTGVINGKLYGGTTSTWDQAATYGMFGFPADGDYELASSFILSSAQNGTYFIGFDKNRKQFLRFNLYGAPMYFGTQYAVSSTTIFDPLNVGMDLIHMEQLNNADCFAYFKGTDGKVYELKFNVEFNGPFQFTPQHKRVFVNQSIIDANTLWQGAKVGVIYLASGNKVYRYNPLNEELRDLAPDLGGKKVTMIKLSEDEQTLVVGVENELHYLDISTGKNGAFIKKISGIPGTPVDMAVR